MLVAQSVVDSKLYLGLRPVSVCDGSTARRDGFRPVRRATLLTSKTDGYGTGSPVYSGPVSVRKRVNGLITATLPQSAEPALRDGLVAAHRKLSDYYTKFDESRYYSWATLLDPRLSYEGLRRDYADDPELLGGLKKQRNS
ncbi:hypothetical protein K438DRAFT_1974705 [Mycena galopus ATCC 62051]|nr:hypothetical protein K438DRAFT_1974705 [Mycena galopus ATCC 62051]